MLDYRRIRNDLLALGLLAATLFVGLCLASYDPADPPACNVFPAKDHVANWCGPVGAKIAHALRTSVGVGSWFVLVVLLTTDIRLFSRTETRDGLQRTLGAGLILGSVCVLLAQFAPSLGGGPVVGSGGYVGASGSALLEEHFAGPGLLVLTASTLAAGMLLWGERILFRPLVLILGAPLFLILRLLYRRTPPPEEADESPPKKKKSAKASEEDDDPAEDDSDGASSLKRAPAKIAPPPPPRDEVDEDDDEPPLPAPRNPIKVNPPVTTTKKPATMSAAGTTALQDGDRRLPSVELLEHPEEFPYDLLAKKARVAAGTLEKTFQEFGLNVRVVEIDTGPVITQFELELEKGLRLNKVTALADDLAIALRVPSVRVVAPIPGKNTVGVEVPNEKQVMVRLRELLETGSEDTKKKRIPFFMGKDVSGRPLVVDLAKMPHLLIAGRTGTGKSVCLNTLILSILATRTPDEVKMLMIDPKMVELSPYRRVPHLMHPVITDMKKAEAVLAWAVEKMEERYDLLARCGVRHIDGYNQMGKDAVLERLGLDPTDPEQELEAEKIPERMPYIVIIADEMADMIMTSGKEVEGHIIRLAQKSRAVGIHLVLATQKPTVDVITGLIKSNLPARISFQVASRIDSRVVLDEMGAERLLGNGDMLYLAPATSNLTRAQGTYVSDAEVNAVIDFYSDQEPQYSTELAMVTTSGGGKNNLDALRARDDMYEQAIEVVIQEGRGSVSLLQRALGIGYGRAARLVDYMAEDGIVGDYNGSQAREVLYTMEQWEELKRSQEHEAMAEVDA